MNDHQALKYFADKGVRTWGALADYLGISLIDLDDDEDLDPADELWDCFWVTDLANMDAAPAEYGIAA